ncbi:mitochondrial protein C2orf69 isoform X1 [Monodelphis domestica]|uniref:Chromosome 2 open reading frame 69 n=1 Tax=Monodelphis domestica TaxID=13616 RepID=F6PQ90_MONDO|nr:mitochondrial protein C2orf69 isoform X1 [Monodelphis domestica]
MSLRLSPPQSLTLLLLVVTRGNCVFLSQTRVMYVCSSSTTSSSGCGGRATPAVGYQSVVADNQCLRLPSVAGADPQRCNELLLLAAAGLREQENQRSSLGEEKPETSAEAAPQHHVLYFPGDVQNYREIMARHPENFQWESWSLENIAFLLAHHFTNSYIWVVKSSRMHLHKFSCYDNFVKSNMFGAPDHSIEFGAFKHLYSLLVNAFALTQKIVLSKKKQHGLRREAKTSSCCRANSSHTSNGCQGERERKYEQYDDAATNFNPPSFKDASFTLIGFSKGCVVLNQLLFELREAQKDKNINSFIKNIRTMYWLDGGHSGGSNTWVTYPEVLQEFAKTGIAVHTHVTPYQVNDPMRSWIGKEHKKFVQILEDFGVQVTNQIHFEKEPPSIENHFRVHEVF